MNEALLQMRLSETGSGILGRVRGTDTGDYFSAQVTTPVVQKKPSLIV
jgi:hypothetical protein